MSFLNRPSRFLFASLLLIGGVATAQDNKFDISGAARVRYESRNNSDFNDTARDFQQSVGSRFRVGMKFHPNETTSVFFQPQFSKVWGQTEFVPSAVGANTETNTSGALNDTGLDIHQAYVSHQPQENLSVVLGRKELVYGDELLVGAVGWSNLGRAFDLALVTYKYEAGAVDIFNAKVEETNVSAASPGDHDFSGFYSSNKISDNLQNADVYYFYSDDATTAGADVTTSAYGLRLKSPVGAFDYRAEATFETVKSGTSTDEDQYDLELGYTVLPDSSTRVSVEYFTASENFNQLFPTGHKWLGYADLFSRRNITGFRAGVSSKVAENLTASLDYHSFERVEDDASAYKFAGAAYGTTGTNTDIATEVDLVLKYKVNDSTAIEAGAAQVMAGDYLKGNGGDDDAAFYYFQVNTVF